MIERCMTVEHAGWLLLRKALWPRCTSARHASEMSTFCANPDRFAQFVAFDGKRNAVGFIEVALRSDYVNGTTTSPGAFLEGIFVAPPARRKGIARALVTRAEQWARSAGCSEFASDARIENAASHSMHRALGFSETERVVYFRKTLGAHDRSAKPQTVDEYLTPLSDEKRAALEKLRRAIRSAVPDAEECISYQIPAFRLGGRLLVAFGAAVNHCAFYPGAFPVESHKDELKAYDISKGTIRFQADRPLPATLVRKLVRTRIAERTTKPVARRGRAARGASPT
jgi:aminoglycoside 6'-N-acetyltransferase I